MKDIVIIANFCRDFSETDNGRFMYLCKELCKENNVEIITSDFSHGKKAHKEPLVYNWPFTITFLHEPGYPTNVCVKRFYSHYVWGKEVGKYLAKRKKPDVIYCAIPSLTAPYEAAKYCEKNGIKFIVDIQDLWPEAFQMVFNIPVLSDVIFAPFKYRANQIYSMADEVCAVSRTYVNRALSVNKKTSEGKTVFLGTNLNTFDEYVKNNQIEKPGNETWLGYCGTLGASYDLTSVLDALVIIRNKGIVPPKFIVMGNGPRKEEFENYAKAKGINAVFMGRLPYDQMCGILSTCDIAVNPITHGAAQSIINKHGDYAASGLPVLNTQECEEYRDLVTGYNMGYNCLNNNADDLAEKIILLLKSEEARKEMGQNARRCAEEKFDLKNSYLDLISLIQG